MVIISSMDEKRTTSVKGRHASHHPSQFGQTSLVCIDKRFYLTTLRYSHSQYNAYNGIDTLTGKWVTAYLRGVLHPPFRKTANLCFLQSSKKKSGTDYARRSFGKVKSPSIKLLTLPKFKKDAVLLSDNLRKDCGHPLRLESCCIYSFNWYFLIEIVKINRAFSHS